MPRGRRADLCQRRDRSGGAQRPAFGCALGSRSIPARRWWWQPAAFPFRKWVRPPSATSWRASSALPCECRPALVPLLLSRKDLADYGDLAGVSTEVDRLVSDAPVPRNMLITHRGLSGPAILQISSYWKTGAALEIDLAPERGSWTQPLQTSAGPNCGHGKEYSARGAATSTCGSLAGLASSGRLDRIASVDDWEQRLHRWQIVPADTEGYRKAEVTAGGVDTDELSAKTMECRKVPGLYFIGEVVDVTGHLGGFNFQWAWASGFCAGQALSKS